MEDSGRHMRFVFVIQILGQFGKCSKGFSSGDGQILCYDDVVLRS